MRVSLCTPPKILAQQKQLWWLGLMGLPCGIGGPVALKIRIRGREMRVEKDTSFGHPQ